MACAAVRGSYQRDPDHWFESNQFFELIHAYHRVFYEHREFSISSDMGTPGKSVRNLPRARGLWPGEAYYQLELVRSPLWSPV